MAAFGIRPDRRIPRMSFQHHAPSQIEPLFHYVDTCPPPCVVSSHCDGVSTCYSDVIDDLTAAGLSGDNAKHNLTVTSWHPCRKNQLAVANSCLSRAPDSGFHPSPFAHSSSPFSSLSSPALLRCGGSASPTREPGTGCSPWIRATAII